MHSQAFSVIFVAVIGNDLLLMGVRGSGDFLSATAPTQPGMFPGALARVIWFMPTVTVDGIL